MLEKDTCNLVANIQKFCPLRKCKWKCFPLEEMFSRCWSLNTISFPLKIFHFDNCRKKMEMWLQHNENELDNFSFFPYFPFIAITCRLLSSAWMERDLFISFCNFPHFDEACTKQWRIEFHDVSLITFISLVLGGWIV